MRITNNAFTAEHGWYSGQSTSSETVQRGGVGAYHGEAQIRFKNAALNALKPSPTTSLHIKNVSSISTSVVPLFETD
jgi:hypothetical protein